MKRLQFLLISILIGVLVGCDADPGKEFDWCYTYEFTSDDFDATIGTGTWESGKGFVTTGGVGGSLSFEVFHFQTVEPSRISMDLYLNRSEITPVSIPFSAFFNVFGIEHTVSDNVPAIIGIQNITVDSSFGGQIGTSARIIVTTDAEVEVARLTVSGLGFNPFPSSDCERVTPTPTDIMLPTATASNTPTVTHTPSITPTFTPSPSLTPSNTPTVTATSTTWCYMADFTLSSMPANWVIALPGPTYAGIHVPGSGISTNMIQDATHNYQRAWVFYTDPGSGFTMHQIDAEYEIVSYGVFTGVGSQIVLNLATSINILQRTWTQWSGLGTGTHTITWTGSSGVTGYNLRVDNGIRPIANGDPGGEAYLRRVTTYGSGYNPFGSDNCTLSTSTPTTAPTDTPDITDTPGPTNTPEPATGTPEPTATATGTAIPTRTPFPTPMILPTSTPDPEDDGNEFGSSGTCTNYGGTEPGAESNGEWTEWLFGGVSNLVECVIMPPINWIGDLVNTGLQMLGNLYDFAVYGVQSFIQSVNWFGGQFIPWALGSLANFFAILWWGLGALISGIFGLLQLIWDTVVAFVSALVSFISTAWQFITAGLTNAQQLVDMWNNAPVVKPPGLPDCVASPTDYDICAFYYVSQNTLLSGIGVIIVPLLTIIVNLLVIGTFIDRIKIFISGLQEVLKQ